MFREIVKDLYIGKSKLKIYLNNKEIPSETLVRDIGLPTLYGNTLPDYGTIGYFEKETTTFKVHPRGDYKLYITGVPKDSRTLDYFRIKGRVWSSYYEDDNRGYLFQVLPYNVKHLETEILCKLKTT